MVRAQILIVEDERIVAEDIRSNLRKMGYAVSAIVSSGEEAVSAAEELRPDLVLMDIVLEGKMNGIEAAGQIRSRFNIPVVYLTAHADDKILERAKMTEPFGYIIKPFEDRELRSAIKIALYKHRMEEALRESEERFRVIFETAQDSIFIKDSSLKYIQVNAAMERLFGLPASKLIGRTDDDLFDKEAAAYIRGMDCRVLKGEIVEKEHTKAIKGSSFTFHIIKVPMHDSFGEVVGLCGIARDITERKQAEQELKKSREQLRNLSAHTESVREKERTLVAREIHDELGQVLTALKMDLSWLSKKLSAEQETLLKKTRSMITLVDATIQTVKRISTELRPGLLDDLGLGAAIEWQAEEFQSRTGIRCHISIDPEDIILDKDRSTAMFRIFQETLTNVTRHAQASKVRVLLREKNGVIELKVQDDGKGIAKRKLSDSKSYGIIGMRERAQFLGGKVEIRSVRGKGTTVLVTIPIRHTGGIQ